MIRHLLREMACALRHQESVIAPTERIYCAMGECRDGRSLATLGARLS